METSLTQIGHAFRWVAVLYQYFTGVIIMKFSLAALVLACAVASPAFAAFDIPPSVPPHAFDIPPSVPPHLALATASGPSFDIPPSVPPHAFDIPPSVPPHAFDIPPSVPPHAAALQQNA